MKITITIEDAGSQISTVHDVARESAGRSVPAQMTQYSAPPPAVPVSVTSASPTPTGGGFSMAGARDGGPAPSTPSAGLPSKGGPVPFMAKAADDFGMGRATPDLDAGGAPGAAQRVDTITVPQSQGGPPYDEER